MEKAEYLKHFKLERDFWWFRGRRAFLLSVLRSRRGPRSGLRVLDAGCGAGLNLKMLEPFGLTIGADFADDSLVFCRQRGLERLVRADIRSAPFAEGSFDLVTLLDVLSHESIRDDTAVLAGLRRILKPGGYLLLSDNAFPLLRSAHDRAYHVRERYRRRDLIGKIERAGLVPVRATYFNFFLFPLVLAVRRLRSWTARDPGAIRSDVEPVGPGLNAVLTAVLRLEAVLVRRVNLPFGSSVVLLARKPFRPS
jgi:SAM-dependent methyltransferase